MIFFNCSVSFFVAFVVAVVVAQHDPNYCYATDPIRPQLNRFSSRTAYETIRGRTINPGVSCKNLATIQRVKSEVEPMKRFLSLYTRKILVLFETCC